MTQMKCRMQKPPCRMRRFVFGSAFGILHFVLLLAPLLGAAPEIPYEQRTDAFRRLLFELRFQPLRSFGELEEKPSESLFIMLGNPACLSKRYLREGLHSFVEQGGAVLIATDMETQSAELRKLAGVRVTGEKLVLRSHDSFSTYSESEHCPFVEPIEESNSPSAVTSLVGAGSRPDLFRHHLHPDQPQLRVATNAPSRLKISGLWLPIGIHRLAKLPKFCQNEEVDPSVSVGSKEYRKSFVNKNGPLFAVGGTVGKGRVLVLADHSIFINRMILPRDNGNLEFAAKCLHWLRGGASTPMEALHAVNSPDLLAGQRNKVLFWDDGVIRSDFEVPLKKVPAPPPFPSESAIVAAIDQTIAKLEASDSFNRALLQQIDDLPGGFPRVLRYAVYLLTLAASLLLAYLFLWRSRHRMELAVPLMEKTLRDHEPRASLLDQRRRALLRLGNVWDMGHRLARECFESAGAAVTGASLPRVRVMKGGRWQRWRTKRRVFRLWRLARGDAPKPLSPVALQRLLRELEQLKTALTDGTIRLT